MCGVMKGAAQKIAQWRTQSAPRQQALCPCVVVPRVVSVQLALAPVPALTDMLAVTAATAHMASTDRAPDASNLVSPDHS